MAVIHKASVSPTKAELLDRILGDTVTVLGSYRFDDPDGEVGVEAFIACCGTETRQIVLTYRGAPLEGAEEALVAIMEHSALGRRWVYNGTVDPVAVACFRRALEGEQGQAVEQVWDGGERVGTLEQTVRLSVVPGQSLEADAPTTIVWDLDEPLQRALGPCLRAQWNGGDAIVACIV